MIVNSGYNILTYNDIQTSTGSRQGGKALPATENDAATSPNQVTISATAKALSDSDSAHTPPRTAAQQRLITAASSDSASAEQIAHDIAISKSAIIYDISEIVNKGVLEGKVKLSSTGRIVDDSFRNAFEKEALKLDGERLALYNSEKAKGTDALKILTMMIDFTNENASDLYKEATGQGWFSS